MESICHVLHKTLEGPKCDNSVGNNIKHILVHQDDATPAQIQMLLNNSKYGTIAMSISKFKERSPDYVWFDEAIEIDEKAISAITKRVSIPLVPTPEIKLPEIFTPPITRAQRRKNKRNGKA